MKNFFKIKFLFICGAAFFFAQVFAEYNFQNVPDSTEIRKKLPREWFEGHIELIRNFEPEIHKNVIGQEFQIRLEEQKDNFLTIVAPRSNSTVNVFDSKGELYKEEASYNFDSPGAWLLVRDKKTGAPILARYYFAQDEEVFVQFRPNEVSGKKNSSYADFVIFDSYAARSVALGVPFSKFYTASFSEIYELTKKNFPWNFALPAKIDSDAERKKFFTYEGDYDNSLVMIETIRENLKNIVYVADAICDENGNSVSLENGLPRKTANKNAGKLELCSHGFVKWIVDGIVEPFAGGYLKRAPLLTETVKITGTGYQGVLSENFNINSAIDWTRNLATATLSVSSKKNIFYENSGVDITIEPFAAMTDEKGILNTAGYIKNSGYKTRYLKPLLYVLAASNPDYFYLAAIRQSDLRDGIETKVFNECAAIFPYFEPSGTFRCVIFYNAREYDLQEFFDECAKNSFAEIFVHLVRVKASAKYYPQIPQG